MNLYQLVLQVVLSHDEVTIGQVLSAVGRYIDSSHACAAGRRLVANGSKRRRKPGKPRKAVIDRGRRHLVSSALCRLKKLGKVNRIRQGVYGPPFPRLYKAI